MFVLCFVLSCGGAGVGRRAAPGHGVRHRGRGRGQQAGPEGRLEVREGQLGGATQPLPGRLPHLTPHQGAPGRGRMTDFFRTRSACCVDVCFWLEVFVSEY